MRGQILHNTEFPRLLYIETNHCQNLLFVCMFTSTLFTGRTIQGHPWPFCMFLLIFYELRVSSVPLQFIKITIRRYRMEILILDLHFLIFCYTGISMIEVQTTGYKHVAIAERNLYDTIVCLTLYSLDTHFDASTRDSF